MDISVVVCTYNRSGLLLECLQSLAAQTLDASHFEVIIVNNNSTDDTQESAQGFSDKHANFRVVMEPEQGHSPARNRGWREAEGQYVAYIDDDCLADTTWAERILQAFERTTPALSAVGGKIVPRYAVNPPRWFSDDMEIRHWRETAGLLRQPQGQYGFSGANMAFPRELIERFGGFSDRFGIVDGVLRMGEDTELFVRLGIAGENRFWYDPEIVVFHWTPPEVFSLAFRLQRSFRCGRGHRYLNIKERKCFPLLFILLSIPLHLIKGLRCVLQPSGKKGVFLIRAIENASHQAGLFAECVLGSVPKEPEC